MLLPDRFEWKSAPMSSVIYPVCAIPIYLSLIFSLQFYMRSRPPLKLRTPTVIHNIFLCVLSFAMALGVLIEVLRTFVSTSTNATREILCDLSAHAMRGRMAWWMYIFYLSKFYELLDTVVMVLKKRRLNFLHVYHHCIVLPLFYVYMSTNMVLQWILVVANSSVHVAMYYYYAMAAVGVKVWWKKYITQAQIIQFIIDLTATWPYPFLYFSASGCSGSMRGWLFGQAVGLSFFKLFRDFYLQSYTNNKLKAQKGCGASSVPKHVPDAHDNNKL
ncbi:putative elongation of fatty acids protein [Gracilariopsis chorda]|uniref:Elongation of fatty acids protein n=1 Tax=Gracilariopsis chorda TaxID=448386 RepID=A0A2V3IST5_9FLOR|nr:putative elongation of fatty acids protein [Gracilariopsis chorda]|eukprot:PXF45183.1 putative elongation of fatty acids protein [Gracilariopsis chorda]